MIIIKKIVRFFIDIMSIIGIYTFEMLFTAKEELYDTNVDNTTIFVGKSDMEVGNEVVR